MYASVADLAVQHCSIQRERIPPSSFKNYGPMVTTTGSKRTNTSNKCQKLRRSQEDMKNKKYLRNGYRKIKPQPPIDKEDWEKEIEEFSRTIEKNNMLPYDPGDELNTTVKEMFQCNIQNGPSSNHGNYSPAVHHTHPVKWVRYVYAVVADQFTDAEA